MLTPDSIEKIRRFRARRRAPRHVSVDRGGRQQPAHCHVSDTVAEVAVVLRAYAADDLMVSAAPKDPAERSALDAACDVVRQILADGPILSDELDAQAKAAGIAKATARRARKHLGVRAEKRGAEWWTRLAGQGAQDPHR